MAITAPAHFSQYTSFLPVDPFRFAIVT